MAAADDEDATPWRTPGSTGAPLNGPAPKKYSNSEIDAAIAKKPAPPPTASKASGEPQREDFNDAISYNLARLHEERGQLDRAVDAYQEILQKHPQCTDGTPLHSLIL